MGIGRLYYFAAAFFFASFLANSHHAPFDGNWHRPRNQFKKKKEKAEAEAAAEAKKLADELERKTRGAKTTKKTHRRRDDTPAPRAHDSTTGAKRDRRGSRAYYDGDGYRDGRHRDGQYSDDSSRSSSYAESRSYHTNTPSRRHSYHRDFETRVKPTPYSDYVPEASVRKSCI